jgi:hypothetical protein
MKNHQFLCALVAVTCLSAGARAQQVSVSNKGFPTATADSLARDSARPVSLIDRPSDAVRRPAATLAAPLPASGQNLGEAKAEMAVGGAAIVVGALIGGDGGSVLMFGGAVVGLYGLWNYLK